MTAPDEQRVREAIAEVALRPCAFCGEGADGNVASFAPHDSTAYGSPPGKRRVLFYALCAHCWATTTPEQRETRIEGWGGRHE